MSGDDKSGGAIRLQKRLAQMGVASRREGERMITAGRVKVNGHVANVLGCRVSPGDRIEVDGREVEAPLQPIAIALHKPAGVITARTDPEGRKTVYDLLDPTLPFLAHVGRLDYQSEGLILFMSDGDLAQKLLRPSLHVPRVYHVKIRGKLGKQASRRIQEGIPLDGRPTRPVDLERLPTKSKHDWLELTLFEGRNRHVRRILEAVGHSVTRLRRVSFAGVSLDRLPEGRWRHLEDEELALLRKLVR